MSILFLSESIFLYWIAAIWILFLLTFLLDLPQCWLLPNTKFRVQYLCGGSLHHLTLIAKLELLITARLLLFLLFGERRPVLWYYCVMNFVKLVMKLLSAMSSAGRPGFHIIPEYNFIQLAEIKLISSLCKEISKNKTLSIKPRQRNNKTSLKHCIK